jgi:hypothetical protein
MGRFFRRGPPPGDLGERPGIEEVELGAAPALGDDEAGRLQHGEVLGDRLPCERQPVPHREHGADLEQGPAVAHRELVEHETPGLVVERAEHIGHDSTIGKSMLAFQVPVRRGPAAGRPRETPGAVCDSGGRARDTVRS